MFLITNISNVTVLLSVDSYATPVDFGYIIELNPEIDNITKLFAVALLTNVSIDFKFVDIAGKSS